MIRLGCGLEALDRCDDRLRSLRVEELAGRPVRIESSYRLERATRAIGDHRDSSRLRFHRRDAEILQRREHEAAGAGQRLGERGVVDPAEQFDVGRQVRLDAGAVGAVADHRQPPVRHAAKGFDDQVHSLVRNESRQRYIWGSGNGDARAGEACNVDRRVHDAGGHRVAASDDRSDMAGVGDKEIDVRRSCQVPAPESLEQRFGRGDARAAATRGPFAVDVRHGPGKTGRRVAVADMHEPRGHPHAFGNGVGVGHHQIVALEIEGFDDLRKGHDRVPEPPARTGHFLEGGSGDTGHRQARAV